MRVDTVRPKMRKGKKKRTTERKGKISRRNAEEEIKRPSEALGFSIVHFTLSEVKKAVIHNLKSRDCGCKPLGRYLYEEAAADLN